MVFASAALAGPPPGVGPSVLVVPDDWCAVGYNDEFGDFIPIYYADSYKLRYSNGAPGHMTFKCKMDLVEGQDPLTLYWEFDDSPFPNCHSTISLEDNKGMWTAQCFGYWAE